MRIDKNGEEITKNIYYILQIIGNYNYDLCQTHYQILLIIFLKEFIELNVNLNMMIKKCETCGIKYKYCDCFLEYTNFKDYLIG